MGKFNKYIFSINESIILLNIFIFFLGNILAKFNYIYQYDFILFNINSEYYQNHQWFTYMFLHSNIYHLFFNMLLLYIFGESVEKYFGRLKYLLFYLICGVVSIISYSIIEYDFVAVLGASGALFGVTMVYALINKDLKIYNFFSIPIKVNYLIFLYIINEFLLSFDNYDNIAHTAHVSGSVIGLIMYFSFKKGAPS